MTFNYRETQMIKGMLARGDKQHDIASCFGVNGGRIAEVATGKSTYPSAPPLAPERLPPAGPYVGAKTVFEIKDALEKAVEEIKTSIGTSGKEATTAIAALNVAIEKIS